MRRQGGLGWLPESVTGTTKTREHLFWENLELDGMVVYDIGAFEGLLTLHFARRAQTVICYEPNTRNHRCLMRHLRLNHVENVIVRKLGISSESRSAVMTACTLMPGGASIDASVSDGLRRSNLRVTHEPISMVRLDDDIRDESLPAPDFIKIDIEGLELAALQGARQTILKHKPQLFLEMHGETMNLKRRKVAEIVAYLEELGYRDIRHVETGWQITIANSADAAEGHLYCGG
jgi:FkbM family methyltransferase